MKLANHKKINDYSMIPLTRNTWSSELTGAESGTVSVSGWGQGMESCCSVDSEFLSGTIQSALEVAGGDDRVTVWM